MRRVYLSKKKFALVDDDVYEFINQWKWRASQNGRTWYAERKGEREDGKQKNYEMHRVIMDAPKGLEVDHINGNGLDNRKVNMRICTHSQNTKNRRKQQNNTSGFVGVVRAANRKNYRAQIKANQKLIYLGVFEDAVSAAKAYDKKAKELFGTFARLNFE